MSAIPLSFSNRAGFEDFPTGSACWADRYGQTEISQFRGAEMLAQQWGFSREQLEELAATSHGRALAAQQDDRFEEILPVAAVRADEGPRRSDVEKMRSLETIITGGLHTADTTSQRSDVAAALLIASQAAVGRYGLRPRARFHHVSARGDGPGDDALRVHSGRATATGADVLWRFQNGAGALTPRPVQELPDGTWLARILSTRAARRASTGPLPESFTVRVIDYTLEDGRHNPETYRLLTTLTDSDQAPAVELALVCANAGRSRRPSMSSKPISAGRGWCCARSPRRWSTRRSRALVLPLHHPHADGPHRPDSRPGPGSGLVRGRAAEHAPLPGPPGRFSAQHLEALWRRAIQWLLHRLNPERRPRASPLVIKRKMPRWARQTPPPRTLAAADRPTRPNHPPAELNGIGVYPVGHSPVEASSNRSMPWALPLAGVSEWGGQGPSDAIVGSLTPPGHPRLGPTDYDEVFCGSRRTPASSRAGRRSHHH